MTHLAYIDTETSGLDIERHAIWELALIIEGHPNPEKDGDYIWQFPIDLKASDAIALSIGGWYERSVQWRGSKLGWSTNPPKYAWKVAGVTGHPNPDQRQLYDQSDQMTIEYQLVTICNLLRGAHLVGANPAFDAYRLERLLRQFDMLSTWHYHLVDIETLMLGWLARSNTGSGDMPTIPWKSDDLSKRIGVETPSGEERHTALGDARWAKRVYERIMG